MRRSSFVLITAVSSLFAGCVSEGAAPATDGKDDTFLAPSGAADAWGVAEGSAQAVGVLRATNELDRDALLNDAGLAATTVNALLAYKAGVDGEAATTDDLTITTLTELDAIPYVGPLAFAGLLAEATARGWVTKEVSTPIEPLRDTTLARLVVKYPAPDGVVLTDIALEARTVQYGSPKQVQRTSTETIIDIPPGNICLKLTTALGIQELCGYNGEAGNTTTVVLPAAYVPNLAEVYGVTVGVTRSVSATFGADPADPGTLTFAKYYKYYDQVARRNEFKNDYAAEGYYALLPGTYKVRSGSEFSNVTVADGEVLKSGLIPTEETRAYLWLSAAPATLPTAREVSTQVIATTAALYGDPDYQSIVWTTSSDGSRHAEPVVYEVFDPSKDQSTPVASRLRIASGSSDALVEWYELKGGSSATIHLARVDVPHIPTTLPDGTSQTNVARVTVQAVGDAGGVIEGESLSFDTGNGVDVFPGRYRLIVTSKGKDAVVLRDEVLDLR